MFRFRTTITLAVMAFIAALAALLILIQTRTFNLTTEQAADVLGMAEATAKRHWAYARAWLYREIQQPEYKSDRAH